MRALRCVVRRRQCVPLARVDTARIAAGKHPAGAGVLCVDGAAKVLADLPCQRDAARRRFFSPAPGGVEWADRDEHFGRDGAFGACDAFGPVEGHAERGATGAAAGAGQARGWRRDVLRAVGRVGPAAGGAVIAKGWRAIQSRGW